MKKINPITWGGLLVALHVIILFVPRIVPGAEIFLMLIAPLFSASYVLKNKLKNTLIFALSTLLVCLLIDAFSTLLFILPIILSGIAYGYLVKAQKDGIRTIYTMSIIQMLLFFISMLLIKFIYQIDVIQSLMTIFKLTSLSARQYAVPLLMLYCFADSFLLHYVLKNEFKKFDVYTPKYEKPSLPMIVLSLILFVVAFLMPCDSLYVYSSIILALFSAYPLIYFFISVYKDRTSLLLILGCVSFLAFTIPLLFLLPACKYPLAYFGIFIIFYLGGIIRYCKIIHFKKYDK